MNIATISARLAPRNACSRRWLSSTTHLPQECDIVIVGGGPVGLALASALGSRKAIRETLSVALVEAGDLSKVREWAPERDAFSNRVSSLTNASQAFLQDIGAWSHIELSRTAPIEEMQISDGISDARISFNAAEHHLPTSMACLTENLNLQRGLLRHLERIPSVEIHDKVRVSEITRDGEGGGWPLVRLDDARVFRARLLVGADGPLSPVRSYSQIPSYGWPYPTRALVSTLVHSPLPPNTNTTAYQRFLPTGPIAFLPLSATRSSLVWSTSPRLAEALGLMEEGAVVQMINAAFRLPEVSLRYLHERILEGQDAGKPLTAPEIHSEITFRTNSHPPSPPSPLPPLISALLPGTLASFPLRFNHVESYVGDRTVLVGDAAHTIHPLAGQGMNLGLADVESLSRCIHSSLINGGDIGSRTALLPYTRERYIENHKMMAAVDKLHKLYSSTAEPVVWARSMGLEVLNELDSLKGAIMASAGASASGPGGGNPGLRMAELAAGSVQCVMGVVGAAKVMGGLVGRAVVGGLRGAREGILNGNKR